jgi:deoxyribonuclease-1
MKVVLSSVLFMSLLSGVEIFSAEEPRGNQTINDFNEAKKQLWQIYDTERTSTFMDSKQSQSAPREFYCGCTFKGHDVDTESCGYVPLREVTKKGKKNKRAYQIEWEHVVPAHSFGQSFERWNAKEKFPECKKLSRRKCAALDKEFARMEADLYNLMPAIGEINQMRSNYTMAEIPGESRRFGKCDIEIEDRKIEPRDEIRGDVARIYLYMDWAYPNHGIISEKNRKLFAAWDKMDPPCEEEKQRARKIMEVQGNCNPFILDCPAAK